MTIADLISRFLFYAINHKQIRHVPDSRPDQAFFYLEGEEIQAAVNSGFKDPCLLLQTPEVEKAGPYDGITELSSFTFVILKKQGSLTKPQVIDECKRISDDIFNLLLTDVVLDLLPGVLAGSTEGIVGPMADRLYGWGKSISLEDGYDAQVDPEKWLHLTPEP